MSFLLGHGCEQGALQLAPISLVSVGSDFYQESVWRFLVGYIFTLLETTQCNGQGLLMKVCFGLGRSAQAAFEWWEASSSLPEEQASKFWRMNATQISGLTDGCSDAGGPPGHRRRAGGSWRWLWTGRRGAPA